LNSPPPLRKWGWKPYGFSSLFDYVFYFLNTFPPLTKWGEGNCGMEDYIDFIGKFDRIDR